MTNEKVETAVRGLKAVGTEITQWENRLEYVKAEVQKLSKSRDTLQEEIDKKTSDYNLFIGQRDAESKKFRADVLEKREQLEKDKVEFQNILHGFQKEKEVFLDARKALEAEQAKNKAELNNIREFITAVQRACGLLNI